MGRKNALEKWKEKMEIHVVDEFKLRYIPSTDIHYLKLKNYHRKIIV